MGPPTPAPIPWRDVRSWCEFYGHAGEDVDFLDALCREMDAVFFEDYAAKLPSSKGKTRA